MIPEHEYSSYIKLSLEKCISLCKELCKLSDQLTITINNETVFFEVKLKMLIKLLLSQIIKIKMKLMLLILLV